MEEHPGQPTSKRHGYGEKRAKERDKDHADHGYGEMSSVKHEQVSAARGSEQGSEQHPRQCQKYESKQAAQKVSRDGENRIAFFYWPPRICDGSKAGNWLADQERQGKQRAAGSSNRATAIHGETGSEPLRSQSD